MTLIMRWLWITLLLVLAVSLSLWLRDHPGDVQLQWGGYQLTTTIWVIIAGVTVLVVALLGLQRLWLKLRANVSQTRLGRELKRQDRSIESVTETMIALSAGDYQQAQKALSRGERLLGEDHTLTHLLQAYYHSRTGERAAMLRDLKCLREDSRASFLAYRSLAHMSREAGEMEDALSYAREAYTRRPDLGEAMRDYLGLLLRSGDLEEAEAVIQRSRKHKAISREQYLYYQALLLSAHAGFTEQRPIGAVPAAEEDVPSPDQFAKLYRLRPDFPTIVHYIEALIAYGKLRQALRVLYQSWKRQPHPELRELLIRGFPGSTPDALIKRATICRRHHPSHIESYLVLAEAYMADKQWEMARNQLNTARNLSHQARMYRLFARLEEQGYDDTQAASDWLKRLSDADPDPAWECQHCGYRDTLWRMHCRHCDSFDSYVWQPQPTALNPGSHVTPATPLLPLDHEG